MTEHDAKPANYSAQWDDAFEVLKAIIAKTPLVETTKWGAPTFTFEGKNIVGIWGFKSYVGIWFHNGVFLKDHARKLVDATETTAKSMRQWRFNSIDEIHENETLILQYLTEAIENHKAGLNLKPEKKSLVLCEFMDAQLSADPNLKAGFEKLSPFKQREFAEYIAQAKREQTKISRFEKCHPMILGGIGLHDKYR